MKRNAENGVLILECIDRSDPGSEGRFLSHMFDLMEVKSQYVEIRTPEQLLSLMGFSPYKYIHVTTHGFISEEKFIGWWTSKGIVHKTDLKALEGKFTDKIIVSTACKSGRKIFCKYIVDKLGCKYCIAPKKSPRHCNSIFFAHVFYHKVFVLHQDVENSYNAYDSRYKNPHWFTIYKRKSRPNKTLMQGD